MRALAFLVIFALLDLCRSQSNTNLLDNNGVSLAVRNAALPNGVSQILMDPGTGGEPTNMQANGQRVPGYGASIAWTPTTTGSRRVIVGSMGAVTVSTPAVPLAKQVYGAAYVYDSEELSYTQLQTLVPPANDGAPGTDPNSRFGAVICASQNSVTSPVLSGTNLYISQPFANLQTRGDESVYFYSASRQTVDLTRTNYLLMQILGITVQMTSGFGTSMSLSNNDRTVLVGAPGYSNIPQSSPAYPMSGPMTGAVYVFQWNPSAPNTLSASSGAYTCQAILRATQAGSQYAQEFGFGTAVAMSGNTFVVGSIGSIDPTGQWNQGVGNVYVYVLQAPMSGTIGAVSAFSTALFVQVIPQMPISNAMAISMSGNYLVVGIQALAQVTIFLSAPISETNPLPDYNKRQDFGGCATRSAAGNCATTPPTNGMGAVVTTQLVDDKLWLYMGQPTATPPVGAFVMSTAPDVNTYTMLGIQGGIEPGFGTSIAFNTAGNYMFAGNWQVQPHVLVISVYFETLGKAAQAQRLVSNDIQTAGAGVFSNFGSVLAGNTNSMQSLIAVGAPLGPSTRGRVYLYQLDRQVTPAIFSYQTQLVGDPGTSFGASMATLLSSGGDIAIIVGAPSNTGATGTAYVDIFFATAVASDLKGGRGIQRLLAPGCIPLAGQPRCGDNYGGATVVDTNNQIIVGAHSFGQTPGTGRTYVYVADMTQARSSMFSLAQTLVSPFSEYGFGVDISLGQTLQAPNQAPPGAGTSTPAQCTPTSAGNSCNMLFVAAMGLPRELAGNYPYTQPNGIGALYIYVNIGMKAGQGQPFSQLQVLTNVPVQLNIGTATGSVSVVATGNDLFVGSIWRNEVRFYRYNGGVSSLGGTRNTFSLQQVLRSPYGEKNPVTSFGCSIFSTPQNRGLMIGALGNGTVFMYLNPTAITSAGRYTLIRVLAAAPRADQFGAAVSSSGNSIIVGAPGANVVSLYPLTSNSNPPGPNILSLPAAQPSGSPTPVVAGPTVTFSPNQSPGPTRTEPTRVPTSPTNAPNPTNVPTGRSRRPSAPPVTFTSGAPQQSFPPAWTQNRPTIRPTQGPTWKRGAPTTPPALRPTSMPTTVPSKFPVYTAFTARLITPYFACSRSGPYKTTFLLSSRAPAPQPTRTPTITFSPTRNPAWMNKSPTTKSAAKKGAAVSVAATPEAKGASLGELLAEATTKTRNGNAAGWHTATAKVSRGQAGSRTTITLDSKAIKESLQEQDRAASRPVGKTTESRHLGGASSGSGMTTAKSAPTAAPVMGYLGFWDQVVTNKLGYLPPGSTTPRTKYYLDITMADTGWGNQDDPDHLQAGQYITFYATVDNNAGPNKVICDMKLAMEDPECTTNWYDSWAPCTGILHPIWTYYPYFDPAEPGCSHDIEDFLPVAENIEVTDYVTSVQGGTLVLTYSTTGVTQPQCPFMDDQGNAVNQIVVRYKLRSVNPFPTFEPTATVEEEMLINLGLATELSPGLGIYVVCLIIGVILYCVMGFRLAVVRSTAIKEGITPVNGFIACMYLSMLGCSLLLDLALAIIIIEAEDSALRVFGFGMLIARLLMILPSIYIISKVYQSGEGSVKQLSDEHFETNGLTYAFYSIFVIFDTQLLAYYPWKVSEFTRMSRGYPDFERIRMSTYPKLVSTIIVMACQGALLDHIHYSYEELEITDHHPSAEIEALISFITVTLIFSVLVLVTVLYEMVIHIPLSKFTEGKTDIIGSEKLEGVEEEKESPDMGMPVMHAVSSDSARSSFRRDSSAGVLQAAYAPTHLPHPLSAPGMSRHMSMGPGAVPPHMLRNSLSGAPPPGMGGPHRQSVGPSTRFMPPGAIHLPHGSPSPPGRRGSTQSYFNSANPRPPMGGGRLGPGPPPAPFQGHQMY